MLTNDNNAAEQDPATIESGDQPDPSDERSKVREWPAEPWWARFDSDPIFVAFKVIGVGLLFVNLAAWVYMLLDVLLALHRLPFMALVSST